MKSSTSEIQAIALTPENGYFHLPIRWWGVDSIHPGTGWEPQTLRYLTEHGLRYGWNVLLGQDHSKPATFLTTSRRLREQGEVLLVQYLFSAREQEIGTCTVRHYYEVLDI